jgi:hypothetical protein
VSSPGSAVTASQSQGGRHDRVVQALLVVFLSLVPPALRRRRDDPLFPPAATLVVGEPTRALAGFTSQVEG